MTAMKRILGIMAVLACVAVAAAQVTLAAESTIKKGWMPDGWGGYRFVLKNTSETPAKALKWTAHWEAKGKPFGDPWGGDLNQEIPAGGQIVHDEVSSLAKALVDAAKPGVPMMVGTVTVQEGDRTVELPYRFPVPGAVLPEPLKLVKGPHVGMALMESRYKTFRSVDRTLAWLNQCYSAMADLTGEKPFGGQLVVLKESPQHPYWAYAGQEIILNTDFVGSTIKDFDDGVMSFGWVHENGHNFDVLGDWYIWSGAAAEWQANFKLCYAFENIPDQSFRIRWTFQAPGFPAPDTNRLLRGTELVEKFFTMFGDAYLADPKRTWDTLSSDEMHSMFQRIQRCYGWEVYKGWYRTYRKLADAGMKPPAAAEDKVRLICAILSHEAKVDLVPVFQRWRFPVTEENVKAMRDKYGIGS